MSANRAAANLTSIESGFEIGPDAMRHFRLQPYEGAPSVNRIGHAAGDAGIAEFLGEPQRAAHRNARRHAKRADRKALSLAFVNEEIDEHFPSRVAE